MSSTALHLQTPCTGNDGPLSACPAPPGRRPAACHAVFPQHQSLSYFPPLASLATTSFAPASTPPSRPPHKRSLHEWHRSPPPTPRPPAVPLSPTLGASGLGTTTPAAPPAMKTLAFSSDDDEDDGGGGLAMAHRSKRRRRASLQDEFARCLRLDGPPRPPVSRAA